MKFVIQRVTESSVKVDDKIIGQIGKGFMVLIGVGQEDTKEIADKRGNRPSFIESGDPALAEELYEYIISKCKENVPVVEKGSFGADMKVSLINDGPFTIVLDSDCM